MKDLIVLVADKNMEFAVRGILQRTESLRIRNISFDIQRHIQNDSGVYKSAHDFLRYFINSHSYAVVMLDREGCGCTGNSSNIANKIQSLLDSNGWSGKSKVIVLDPELEIWVWSDSPEVAGCLGWSNPDLRNWLTNNNHIRPDAIKPHNPKHTFEEALRIKNKARSSSIYEKLATKVSLDRCEDNAFQEFKGTLQEWFPLHNNV